jgi:hypothetical protein
MHCYSGKLCVKKYFLPRRSKLWYERILRHLLRTNSILRGIKKNKSSTRTILDIAKETKNSRIYNRIQKEVHPT